MIKSNSKCPSLSKERIKTYRIKYQKLHREEILERKRIYRESRRIELAEKQREYNRTHRDELAKKQKIRRDSQKEIVVGRSKKYYEKNTDRIKERIKKYSKTPQGKLVNHKAGNKRRSIGKIVENTLTLKQWNKILKLQDNRCNICKRKFGNRLLATQDHIIPLSKGGGFTFENIQALCKSCNSTKQAKLDKSFIVTWISPQGVVS
jgi:5-methylcytosine-specific restriction endonuclease McrA